MKYKQIITRNFTEVWVDRGGIHALEKNCKRNLDEKEIQTSFIFIDLFFQKNYSRGYTKTKNSSYGLKHMAESVGSYLKKQGFLNCSPYVANGSFIYAAYKKGFSIIWKPEYGLNCFFNARFPSNMGTHLLNVERII